MDKSSSRARFPKRMSVQVTQELKDQLGDLAQREYGGDLQGLLRETLYARLNGPGNDQAEVSEVLRALEQIRQEAAERNRESGAQLERLMDAAAELIAGLSVQSSDTMGILERVEKALGELADINNREAGAQLEPLLDATAQLSNVLHLQSSDTMGVRDSVEKAINELADINNRIRWLEQGLRDRSGGEGDL